MNYNKKALFVDFEDSFSLNIIQWLEALGYYVTKSDWRCFQPHLEETEFDLLVFGPGPGHISEYQACKDWLSTVGLCPEFKTLILGICLGHQLIASAMGLELFQLEKPYHGVQYKLCRPDNQAWWPFDGTDETEVMLYNSWAVRPQLECESFCLWQDEEMLLSIKGEGVITYQFHPESVGTSHPMALSIIDDEMRYNRKDGKHLARRRHLRSQNSQISS
jgi:anthranilate synthase component II